MNLTGIILFIISAVFCAVQSSVVRDPVSLNAHDYLFALPCIVEYLKESGKLDDRFPSLLTRKESCPRPATLPPVAELEKSLYKGKIEQSLPDESECLIIEFDNRQIHDYILKAFAISDRMDLLYMEKAFQLDNNYNELLDELKEMAVLCDADNAVLNDLIILPKFLLWDIRRQRYCLTTYAIDHNLLKLSNVTVIPNTVDQLTCERFYVNTTIDAIVQKLRDQLDQSSYGKELKECFLNAYADDRGFDFIIAKMIVKYLKITSEEREQEWNRIQRRDDLHFHRLLYKCFEITRSGPSSMILSD